MAKPIVLISVPYYLPGYRSGGPVRSINNMVNGLSKYFDFRIVTSDRDLGDIRPYPTVSVNAWNQVGQAQVYYASPTWRCFRLWVRLLNETPHDILYLNSFFHPRFTICPLVVRRLDLIPPRPLVLATRGELSRGALSLKWLKKRAYILLARPLGLYRNILWHASSRLEAQDIRRAKGILAHKLQVAVAIASDLPLAATKTGDEQPFEPRAPGTPLRVCFLARISPMKNLEYALAVLARVKHPVQFNVFGNVEDPIYWKKCQLGICQLPAHITVTYHGQVPAEKVKDALLANDLYFLPTKGENFGHSIVEALGVGMPVLISDQTPWRYLERDGVGWSIPLGEQERFGLAIDRQAEQGLKAQLQQRQTVLLYYRRVIAAPRVLVGNRRLFRAALLRPMRG